MYSVCLSLPLRNTEWYTFTISVNRGRHMVGRPSTNTYIQTLINNDCWKRRTKIGDDSWSDWTEYRYAYTEDLTSKQDKSDSSLQTTAKTVVGAINEVNTKSNNIEQTIGNEDMSAEHAQSIKGAIAEINYWKGNASQDIEHAIGDIKELQSAVNSKQPLGDYAQAQHTHVFADITDVSILPDNDAQIIIPIDDDILTSIVNQTYSPEDTAMFSGHSDYLPLSNEEVTRLVDLTIETYRQAINLNN